MKKKPVQPEITESESAQTDSDVITIGKKVVVKNFAARLGLPVTDVITTLIQNGFMVNMNQEIDFETAELIAPELGKKVALDEKLDAPITSRLTSADLKNLTKEEKTGAIKRPPVVVVMGHVDHGKTTLLDAIRETDEASKEAGHITQHIGAYQVTDKGREITFLDTPGHEAFVEMRQKGADITDIAVLVVAANDGVQPQTVEAMNHARAAGVPIIVALNKIDLPDAKPDLVKKALAEIGLNPEEWGGDTIFVEVSAKQKKGIKELEDTILLVADVQELKADPKRKAVGYVIEANMSAKGGPVASVIVKTGTLKVGDPVAVGDAFGNIRSIVDFRGKPITEAAPSMPIQIMGLNKVPLSGDVLEVVDSRSEAKERAEKINTEEKALRLRRKFEAEKLDEAKRLPMIIKTDVQGSADAIVPALQALTLDGFRVDIIKAGVGEITDSDIMLATPTAAWIVGFNVKPSANAKRIAEREKIEITEYKIIYDLIEEVKRRIAKLVGPEVVRTDLGKMKVLAIFRTTKSEMIIGGKITKGVFKNRAKIEVVRGDEKVGEGDVTQLQQDKKAVDEVKSGLECGIQFKGNVKVKEGDELVAYETENRERKFA